MDEDAQTTASADAEWLLTQFGPTPAEAAFVREQGEAIFAAVFKAFFIRTRNGSAHMRPMTVEMAIAYPAFAAAAWARRTERERGENVSDGKS